MHMFLHNLSFTPFLVALEEYSCLLLFQVTFSLAASRVTQWDIALCKCWFFFFLGSFFHCVLCLQHCSNQNKTYFSSETFSSHLPEVVCIEASIKIMMLLTQLAFLLLIFIFLCSCQVHLQAPFSRFNWFLKILIYCIVGKQRIINKSWLFLNKIR